MPPGASVQGAQGWSPVAGGTWHLPGPAWPRAHTSPPLPHLLVLVREEQAGPGATTRMPASNDTHPRYQRKAWLVFWLEVVTWKREGVSNRRE